MRPIIKNPSQLRKKKHSKPGDVSPEEIKEQEKLAAQELKKLDKEIKKQKK